MPTILLDEGVPRPILRAFPDGAATSVDLIGWRGIKNGALLQAAEVAGFAVLITTDKNVRHQNSLAGMRLAVVALPHANWPKLRDQLGNIAHAVTAAEPGTFSEMVATADK